MKKLDKSSNNVLIIAKTLSINFTFDKCIVITMYRIQLSSVKFSYGFLLLFEIFLKTAVILVAILSMFEN